MNQTTNVHSLFRNRQGNPDSTIREIFSLWDREYRSFVCGIRNTGNFCLWDPEYGKFLFVGSEIVALESLIPAQGIRNPANNWNTKFKFH